MVIDTAGNADKSSTIEERSDMSMNERRKILLIDDDPSLLTTLADFLAFEGYDVETAESAESGLAVLTSVNPDLIILDMSMPGMGGVGFLREVTDSQGTPSHPVLVLTARANMAEFFANVEVDGFVAKPCDPQDLLMEVSRIIFLRSGDVSSVEGEDTAPVPILLGESNPQVLAVLRTRLTDNGFEVISITDGPSILEKAIMDKPVAVVVRADIEGLSGARVAEMLKSMPNTRQIPVLIYAAEGVSPMRADGADVVLPGADPDSICMALQGMV
jgi:CheY-like chemotaxis protein